MVEQGPCPGWVQGPAGAHHLHLPLTSYVFLLTANCSLLTADCLLLTSDYVPLYHSTSRRRPHRSGCRSSSRSPPRARSPSRRPSSRRTRRRSRGSRRCYRPLPPHKERARCRRCRRRATASASPSRYHPARMPLALASTHGHWHRFATGALCARVARFTSETRSKTPPLNTRPLSSCHRYRKGAFFSRNLEHFPPPLRLEL